jgi:DNA-directed RNA polymerase specialized sigma24 family protein
MEQIEIHDKEIDIASNIAKSASAKWSLVEYQDLAQTLILWLFEHRDAVVRYRTEQLGQAKLITALKRHATQYCVKEQLERSGIPLDSSYKYSMQQIERGLSAMFNFSPLGISITAHPSLEPNFVFDPRIDDARAVILDCKSAFDELLNDEERVIIAHKYEKEYTYRDIGILERMSATGARKKIRRILRKIQVFLNR